MGKKSQAERATRSDAADTRAGAAPSSSAPPFDRRRAGLFALALVAGVVLVYAQIAGHRFLDYDTAEYLTRNGDVQRGLGFDSMRWALTSSYAANWHPLTWWSHMLDVSLFGLDLQGTNPGHHLHNLALHLANTLFVFALFARWTGKLGRSALVAALFGLHPMHVESVAWIVERKDLLSTFYGLLFLHAWTGWTRAPGLGKYALAWVLLALGLMAKPMVITLPCALFLLDVWPLGRADVPIARRVVEKLPFAPLMIASAWLTSAAQHGWGAMSSVDHIGAGARVANALWAWPQYAWKLVVPYDLVVFVPWRDRTGELGVVAAWAAVFVVLCVLALLLRRRAPYAFSGWYWLVGTLVPVIGLVQVGDQAMADRYSYLPSIGFFAALVWGVAELATRVRLAAELRMAFGVGVALLAAFLGWKQCTHWKDTETMARRGLAIDPSNYKFRGMLGYVLSERASASGDRAEAQRLNEAAIAEFQAAIASNPESVIDLDRLAYQYMRLGRNAEAEPLLLRALAHSPRNSQVLNHLGGLRVALGKWADAEKHFEAALDVDPRNEQACNNLGFALEQQGKIAQAETMSRRALALLPNYVRAQLRLAVQLRKQGKLDDAAAALKRAGELGIKPFDQPEYDAEIKLLQARSGGAR
ncbi:MAG: tetratricopeptide repeat protein [Planctomycetes bacterium]|nr:tetratricopeptide repeat protein [Planctomycetota bacterium]